MYATSPSAKTTALLTPKRMVIQSAAFSWTLERSPTMSSASIQVTGASAVVLDPDAAERDRTANTDSIVAYLTA